MNDSAEQGIKLPPEQQAIRDKCFHPSGTFVEFRIEDVQTSIPERFEKIMRQFPDRVAVKTPTEVLTYRELDDAANRLAMKILGSRGYSAEPIGVMAGTGTSLVSAILAVLKAGKFVVTLDPSFPKARTSAILEDSQAALVVADKENHALATDLFGSTREILNLESSSYESAAGERRIPINSEDIAFIFYTSGSTGDPKGVIQTHRNVLHNLMLRMQVYHVSEYDRVSLLSSGTSNAVMNMFLAVLNGASLLPFDVKQNGVGPLVDWLVHEGITICWISSPLLRAFCECHTGVESFPDLRALRLTSETVYARDVELYKKVFSPDCVLVTGLSSSETGPLRKYLLDHNTTLGGPDVPVGYALPGKEVFLLDDNGNRLGGNQVGEIVVRSPYLTAGYWRRPDLTKAKLKADFQDEGSQLYLTGDLGEMLADGCLIHKGRKDFRIKIRGYGVETAEVERALLNHPAIREAVVVGSPNAAGEMRLLAYIVFADNPIPTTATLRAFLNARLPDYMIPSGFSQLDSVPLTPAGKLDRKALPSIASSRPEIGVPFIEPRTADEVTLGIIWSDALGIDRIGINDDFFDLGGHSLSAAKVINRTCRTYEIECPLRTLFEFSTIKIFAAHISQLKQQGSLRRTRAIVPTERSHDLPLSFGQQRLWFLDRLNPGSSDYNLLRTYRLTGHLNIEALERSINAIVQRHESLRSVIRSMNGVPYQVVLPSVAVAIRIIDLRRLNTSEERIDAELRQRVREEAQRPFDLENGPLLRFVIILLAENDCVLVRAFHHIVFDVWSMGVFARELATLYRSFCNSNSPMLPLLPIQYADYAIWQRGLSAKELDSQLKYWKSQFRDLPKPLRFQSERSRLPNHVRRGARHNFTLSGELGGALVSLAGQQRATLFMVLIAGFSWLLHRQSHESVVVIGSPSFGRDHSELENLIGFFLNILALRIDMSGNPTFRELLARVREVSLDAYANQDVPFEKVVEDVQPARSMDCHPLFQTTFTLDNLSGMALQLDGITVEEVDVDSGVVRYDMEWALIEEEGRLRGFVDYDTSLFDGLTIARMSQRFSTLLEGIVANPDQRISELPLLTEAEKQQILVDWNNTQTDYLKDECIHQLFESQVWKTPDAVAVVFENQQISYRELNHRANELAHYLITAGVRPGTAVGIYLDRSIELAVALLAALKAGGVYVPIDTSFPSERVNFMLQDVQAPFVVSTQALAPQLSPIGVRIVTLDTELEKRDHEDVLNPRLTVGSRSPAYILYTSGSTGTPKGVVMDHRALNNLICWQVNSFGQGLPARTLQFAPLGFDVSIQEMFSTWCAGGSLYFVRNELRQDGSKLLRYIDQQSIERIFLPFVALQHFAEIAVNQDCTPRSLREIVTAGEQLRLTKPLRLFLDRLGNCRLHNQYGPTESHVVTEYTVNPPFQQESDLPPIGRPIANTQVYILDAQLNPVPIGVAGELHIGGDSLARGYFNRPDLSQEKFIANPFSKEPGARLYKTGDLARYLADGNIEFLGRIDNQVKIRGYRIELGEIESVLAQHEAVQQAVVLAREDTPGDRRLVAYAVASEGSKASAHDLRSFLQQKLPEYMLPSAFVFLDSLPLTPNGKLDRNSLPAPDQSRPDLADSFVAPTTPVEENLANIWAEVLKLDKVGIHDNFFHLGGHSLLATQVVSRIRDALKLDLPLRALFEAPTIEGLAEKLQELGDKQELPQTGVIRPIAREQYRVQRTNVKD